MPIVASASRPARDRRRHGYSFREGLAMMAAGRAGIDPELAGEAGDEVRDLASLIARAANARDAETRSLALQEARAELARFDAGRFPALARALRTRLAQLDPTFSNEMGESGPDVVVPAWVHTPELLQRFVAGQVARGVDPARIRLPTDHERAAALHDAGINPATGMQEFGLWSSIKSLFGRGEEPSRAPAPPAAPPQIAPIPITGRRATERLGPPAGIERISAAAPAAPRFVPQPTVPELYPSWFINHLDPSRAGLEPSMIHNPTGGIERNDLDGKGWFGASRDGGSRPHNGVDITVPDLNASVRSVIDGKVISRRPAYSATAIHDNPALADFDVVEIEGTGPFQGLTARLRYVDRNGPKVGETVVGGVTGLGHYQPRHLLSRSGKMLPHVHLETSWKGRPVDAGSLLQSWQTNRRP